MADYSVDGLLTAVRDAIYGPTWDEGADTRLLRVLNREQNLYLTALIKSAREEYRTATLSITLTAGRTEYHIPARAVASGLKMIQAVDSAGSQYMLYQQPAEDVPFPYSWTAPNGQFFIRGNRIVFYTAPTNFSSLTVSFPRRLSELVLLTDTTNARAITAINTSTKAITVAASMSASGLYFDLVQANPQFDLLAADLFDPAWISNTAFFTDALPDGLAVGDYLCVAQKAPVCLAPYELHAVLVQRVAYMTLLAKGDPQAQAAERALDGMAEEAMKLLQPRPEKTRALRNPNAPGMTFGGWRGWWRG